MAYHNTGPLPMLDSPIQSSLPINNGSRPDNPTVNNLGMGNTPEISHALAEQLDISDSSDDPESYGEEYGDEDSSLEDDSDELRVTMQGLAISSLPTGLCYDERMRYHSEVSATTGENVHPEDPRRIYYISW